MATTAAVAADTARSLPSECADPYRTSCLPPPRAPGGGHEYFRSLLGLLCLLAFAAQEGEGHRLQPLDGNIFFARFAAAVFACGVASKGIVHLLEHPCELVKPCRTQIPI